MKRVRVADFTISLEGFGAGPNQDIGNPPGVGGTQRHQQPAPILALQRALFGKSLEEHVRFAERELSAVAEALLFSAPQGSAGDAGR
jgi:hypothetical protein